MNRNSTRVATYITVIGTFLLGATAPGQQPQYRGGPGVQRTQSPPASAGNSGSAPASNIQARDGQEWQSGEEPPRGNAQPRANQPAGAQRAPNQPGPQPQARAPFVLTPAEEASLDQILIAWERQSGQIKTYKCEFTRWEYGLGFGANPADKGQPRTVSTGELKYSAPDKGMFHVNTIDIFDANKRQLMKGTAEDLEHWVCDGKSVFEIDHKKKTRTEKPLPPQMQGQAISDGPLPFVFGAKAATLKQRYWMREIPNVPENERQISIWLQAFPRFQADAANFKYVEIILGRKDFMPQAIQMYSPAFNPNQGNDSRTVFKFEKTSFNGRFDNVFTDFVAPDVPFTYKKIVMQPVVEAPPTGNAQAPSPDQRSARAPGRSPAR